MLSYGVLEDRLLRRPRSQHALSVGLHLLPDFVWHHRHRGCMAQDLPRQYECRVCCLHGFSEARTKGMPRSITTSRTAHIFSGVLTGQKMEPKEICTTSPSVSSVHRTYSDRSARIAMTSCPRSSAWCPGTPESQPPLSTAASPWLPLLQRWGARGARTHTLGVPSPQTNLSLQLLPRARMALQW